MQDFIIQMNLYEDDPIDQAIQSKKYISYDLNDNKQDEVIIDDACVMIRLETLREFLKRKNFILVIEFEMRYGNLDLLENEKSETIKDKNYIFFKKRM